MNLSILTTNSLSFRLDVTLNEIEEIIVDVVIQGYSCQNK